MKYFTSLWDTATLLLGAFSFCHNKTSPLTTTFFSSEEADWSGHKPPICKIDLQDFRIKNPCNQVALQMFSFSFIITILHTETHKEKAHFVQLLVKKINNQGTD